MDKGDTVHVCIDGEESVGVIMDIHERECDGEKWLLYRVEVKKELWVNGFELKLYKE